MIWKIVIFSDRIDTYYLVGLCLVFQADVTLSISHIVTIPPEWQEWLYVDLASSALANNPLQVEFDDRLPGLMYLLRRVLYHSSLPSFANSLSLGRFCLTNIARSSRASSPVRPWQQLAYYLLKDAVWQEPISLHGFDVWRRRFTKVLGIFVQV